MDQLTRASVLLAGPQQANLDLYAIWLRREGATVHFAPFNLMLEAAVRFKPNVIAMDVGDRYQVAHELLESLTAQGTACSVSTIALVAPATSSAILPTSERRFAKYIVAPLQSRDLISAVASLVAANEEPLEPVRASSLSTVVRARAQRKDMRGALELLNSSSPFRFTSILRFDGEQLVSVWTYDREAPKSDGFPIDATVASSYCSVVRAAKAPFVLPDASLDASVANHPKRHTVLSYCGVPLFGEGQTLYGSLCHYDLVPRMVGDRTLERLQEAAQVLTEHLRPPS